MILFGVGGGGRDRLPALGEHPAPARRDRASLPPAPDRQCVRRSSSSRSPRRSGSRPGRSPRAGAAAGESTADRPDVVTGAQVHAVVATPSDSPDQFAAVANQLAGRRRLDERLVDRPGPDARSALRPGDVPRRHVPRHLVRPSAAARERLRRRPDRLRRDRERARRTPASSNPCKDYLVYYDGPSVRAGRLRRRRRRLRPGRGVRDRVPERLPRRARRQRRRRTSCCMPSARSRPGRRTACTPATDPVGGPTPGIRATRRATSSIRTTDGRPLQQQVLDFNHDDYYAHSGVVDRHPGHDLPASPEHAGGGARRHHLGARSRDERPARRRLHGRVHHAVGSGDGGDARTDSAADSSRFIHWTGGCTGSADCVLDLSKPAAVTAVFGPLTIPVDVSTTRQGPRRVHAELLEAVLGR